MDTECSHGPLTALEEEKKPMEKDSKAHKAVRDVVFDKGWLRTLVYYVLFRYDSFLKHMADMQV